MNTIQVSRPDLYQSLWLSPLLESGTKSSSFAIQVTLSWKGKKHEGKLILSARSLLHRGQDEMVLSITGTVVLDEKAFFFSGIYERQGDHESCSLLVLDPDVIEVSVSREEFRRMAREYCESRNIPLGEDGNILGDEFPFFMSEPKDGNAPSGKLRCTEVAGVEISTILLRNFFPVINWGEACFGKFVGEHKIRIYTKEEMSLLVEDTVYALQ